MANVKEPVTTHNCILKYAIIEQIQQLDEDSRLATTIPDTYKGLTKLLWVNALAKDCVTNKAILN